MRTGAVRTILCFLLSALILAACAAPSDPVEIVQAFIAAVDSENLDAAHKLLADEFVVGYGGGEEQTITKAEVRLAAEKVIKDYNFSLEASNFQLDGSQVYFSITITDDKDDKSANCTCEATITDGVISRLKVLFCADT